MLRVFLKSKIHRATVTDADLNYVGSITIDEDLMDAAEMMEYEQVHVLDITNGNRLQTYVIKGIRGSGVIAMNGAAARLIQPGDKVIIIAYCMLTDQEVPNHIAKVVLVDQQNRQITPPS